MNYDDLYDIMSEGIKDAPSLSRNYNDDEWELTLPKDLEERPPVNDWEYFFDGSDYPFYVIRFKNNDDINDVKEWLIARMIKGDRREAYKRAKALIEMLYLGSKIRNVRSRMDICCKQSDSQNVGYDELLSGMPDPEPVYARLQSVAQMWKRTD